MAWQIGTLVESHMVAENVKSLRFSVATWQRHRAGQHYDIRLTAENGYQAQRSYSIGNAPEDAGFVEFGVQILEGGEVSPYLWQMKAGEKVELRGPLGGHFVWEESVPGPLLLLGGGSGAVPLMCMLRHHLNNLAGNPDRDVLFLISARSLGKIPYHEELETCQAKYPKIKILWTLTDSAPENYSGLRGRVNGEMLLGLCGSFIGQMPMIYICGPTGFVEGVSNNLVSIGFNPHEIRTERFGG